MTDAVIRKPAALEADAIRALLPHRFPMLLLDRVLEVEPGQRLTAVKAITANEPWYADGGDPGYQPVLLIESWGQAAGVLALLSEPGTDLLDGRVMLFGSMSGVEIHRRVLPGDVLEHRVKVFRSLGDTVIFEGECVTAGEPVLTVNRMVMAFRTPDEPPGGRR
ncbi:3-hydroxyacyl-[acyl-carrier-protein] dehydratase [Saccharothrix ecbatanensis]|uniref:3-hydroxyacyl-[acyl-carrier-protein] dehydratase n=1 Tax=Saccharothrix ecbatanensis TaxID=1105145 RepID=A0A7W9M162_9PSEU|nr:3-hydroxyacyl-ACP dehydratase FabZ family protein [Saccharothrix ecbatanensis]MBB5803639.1 3-hydroxyacyl-[acyl-carrier-protein] dehydratase [Saccharothrix ecbatanensis]